MKRQGANYFVSIVVLITIQLLYFFWQPYPKGILKNVGGQYWVQDFTTNVVFYLMFFTAFVLMVRGITFPMGAKGLGRKKWIKIILVLLLIQLGFDIISQFTGSLSFFSVIGMDLCTVLSWLAMGFVVLRLLKVELGSSKRTVAAWWVCGTLVVIAYGLTAVWNIIEITRLLDVYQKYGFSNNEIVVTVAENADFRHSVRNALLDTATGIVLLTGIFLSRKIVPETEKNARYPLGINVLAKLILCVIFFSVVRDAKKLILPHSSLYGFNGTSSITTHYAASKSFDLDTNTITISRMEGNASLKTVYYVTKCEVWYADQKLAVFELDGKYSSMTGHLEGNGLILENAYNTYDIEGVEVNDYFGQAVSYLDKGIPRYILAEDIPHEEWNLVLTNFCKTMIENGHWEYFEYAGQYLMRHDPQFIQQYIKQYSKGNFTSEEIGNNQIRPEYIQNVAQSFLKEEDSQ